MSEAEDDVRRADTFDERTDGREEVGEQVDLDVLSNRLAQQRAEIARLRETVAAWGVAMERASAMLKCPAAEYVPAMPEAWEILDEARKGR